MLAEKGWWEGYLRFKGRASHLGFTLVGLHSDVAAGNRLGGLPVSSSLTAHPGARGRASGQRGRLALRGNGASIILPLV